MKAIKNLEVETKKSFTGDEKILLVSVRSGAAFSMPGMMDTILNLGLNDLRVQSLARLTSMDFAFDCYRRLLQMFGDVVYGIHKDKFNVRLQKMEKQFSKTMADFQENEHLQLIESFKALFIENDTFFLKIL